MPILTLGSGTCSNQFRTMSAVFFLKTGRNPDLRLVPLYGIDREGLHQGRNSVRKLLLWRSAEEINVDTFPETSLILKKLK